MDLMMQHAPETPVPPARRTEIAIPAALDELILSCLEKDPDRRPRSAEVLEERLLWHGTHELRERHSRRGCDRVIG